MKKILAATALSLALLSGTALAQVSVDTGAGADVSVGGVDAGANAGGNAGASTTGSKTDANGNLIIGANTSTDDTNVDATVKADANAAAETDTVDTEATASVGADAKINAILDGFGEQGNAFFADDTKTEVKSEAEVQAAFAALSVEQQAELRAGCAEASGSAVCGAIVGL